MVMYASNCFRYTPNCLSSNCFRYNLEFTIVILIHYKPRVAVAILDLLWMKKIKENCHVLVSQFHGIFRSKTLGFRKLSHSSQMLNDALMRREGLKG